VRLMDGEDRAGAHRIYFNRAAASAAVKDWDAAIADYQKSISINSQYPEVRIFLGDAYASAGRYREALAEYDKFIAVNPKNARAYYGKGFVLKKMHDDAGAMQQMEKSCQLGLNQACLIASMRLRNK